MKSENIEVKYLILKKIDDVRFLGHFHFLFLWTLPEAEKGKPHPTAARPLHHLTYCALCQNMRLYKHLNLYETEY